MVSPEGHSHERCSGYPRVKAGKADGTTLWAQPAWLNGNRIRPRESWSGPAGSHTPIRRWCSEGIAGRAVNVIVAVVRGPGFLATSP